MKIAVASTDGKKVSEHFGHSAYFVLYEIKDGKVETREVLENRFAHHAGHHIHHRPETGYGYGHGHHNPNHEGRHDHAGIMEALNGCSMVISGGIGWRMAEDLRTQGIKTLFTQEGDTDSAIDKYIKGELQPIEGHLCGHRH